MLVQLDIASEEAQLKGARAQVELARLELERARTLFEKGSGNRVGLDKAQASFDIAVSNLELIERVIAQKTIRAPFKGQTPPGQLAIGQYLTPGQEVTQITDQGNTIWVDFRMPQFLGVLWPGKDITVYDSRRESFSGRLISQDARVDSDTRTRLYRAAVSSDSEWISLAQGSYVDVDVALAAPVPVVELPVTALQADAYGQFVNLLVPAEQNGAFRAKRQDVQDVIYRGDKVLIGAGLTEGMQVATDGSFKLYPGVLTYVVDDLPSPSENTGGW